LSATGIDRDYDTARTNNNKNKVNTDAYEPRDDAEDQDGNGVSDTVKSYSQSRADIFEIALCPSFSSRLKPRREF